MPKIIKQPVQGTNDNSIVSKLSMVNFGYHDDKNLHHFVIKAQRRSSLINRGYYLRSKAIRSCLQRWLINLNSFSGDGQKKQIISLGAGFDTTYFWLKENVDVSSCSNLHFIEVDYPEVIQRKFALADKSGLFESEISMNKNSFSHRDYSVLGHDLRNLDPVFLEKMKNLGVNPEVPTFFLSEVVMAYLTSSQSTKIVSWINHNFRNAFVCMFEQMLPDDGFGKVMCNHFSNIGGPLLTVDTYPTLNQQSKRFHLKGFDNIRASSLQQYYTSSISMEEKQRVDSLEVFDEFEGWHQMCLHYFILCATNSQDHNLHGLLDQILPCSTILPFDPVSSLTLEKSNMEILGSDGNNDLLQKNLIVYGHASAVITRNNGPSLACVAGGFGIPLNSKSTNGKSISHRRLDSIVLLDLESHKVIDSFPAMDHHFLHSSIVSLQVRGNDYLLAFGGRKSPMDASDDIRCFSVLDSKLTAVEDSTLCNKSDVKPTARWRHSADVIYCTSVTGDGAIGMGMFLYGGRDQNNVFSDSWMLDFESKSWRELQLQLDPSIVDSGKVVANKALSKCHSHSSTVWKNNLIVASGGLDENMVPLNTVSVINPNVETFIELEVTPQLLPRYSHSSHIIADKNILLLVGGVIFPETREHYTDVQSVQENIDVVHLETGTWMQTVRFPSTFCERPIRVISHSSYLTACKGNEDYCITIVGGGSNCFSFGTAFSSSPLSFRFSLKNR